MLKWLPDPIKPVVKVIQLSLIMTGVTFLDHVSAQYQQPTGYDWVLLIVSTLCGMIAALVFGVSRKLIPLPDHLKAWVIAFLASAAFCVLLNRLLAFSARTVVLSILVLGLIIRFDIWFGDRRSHRAT